MRCTSEAAFRWGSDHPANVANLGVCLLARQEAARFLAKLAELPGSAEHVRRNEHVLAVTASCFDALGRGPEASVLRQREIAAGSRNAVFYNDEALYCAEHEGPDKGLEVLDKARELGIEGDHSTPIRATLLEKAGRGPEASALRQREIAAGSRNAALYNDEALYCAEREGRDKGLAILDKARELGIENDYLRSARRRLQTLHSSGA